MEGDKTMKTKHIPPRATRMIEGLRDTGYDFNTAMADIIDNSIAAAATNIEIYINMDFSGDVSIYIADNGCGMDEAQLENAMTYGSLERPSPASLGKFGMGLKTASTAFCRQLSVSSRPAGDRGILKARWDLDYIADDAKDWMLQYPDLDEFELELFDKVAKRSSGTVVTWQAVDRLIKEYADKRGAAAQRALRKTIDSLQEHISMVFQRFLDSNYIDTPNVSISINEVSVEAWDPFYKNNSKTIVAAELTQAVQVNDETSTSFKIGAYILPRKEEFDSDEDWRAAKLNNDLQGFYIYRENRLIHYGGWLGMYTTEPHSTLLRIEFSFDHTLDEAFNVDIKKSRILLSGELFNWLKTTFLPAPRRAANERYRKGINTSITKAAKGAHDGSNAGLKSHENDVKLASFEVTNPLTGEVEVTNRKGRFTIKIPIVQSTKEGELFVQPVDSIDDGALWEPCLIDQHHAIRINTKHPYYQKIYIPNINSGVTIQGMDSLLWALGEAENGIINDKTKFHIKELRYEVSRILRYLMEDLPDPEIENE